MKTIIGILIMFMAGFCIPLSGWSDLAEANEQAPATDAETSAAAIIDINAPITGDNSTALHCAARNNRLAQAQALLEQGANVNAANNIGVTPLHQAALAGHHRMVALLLANQANIQAQDHFGLTPLHMAAQYGHVKTIQLLLAYNADLEARTFKQGLTPLHWAAFYGHVEGLPLLLRHGADINVQDNTGNTPLTWAEAYGHYDMSRLLARKGGRRQEHEKIFGLNASFHIQ